MGQQKDLDWGLDGGSLLESVVAVIEMIMNFLKMILSLFGGTGETNTES